MDFKEKSDFVMGMTENIKEWVINQPKKRCGLIEGHDNYWEGKIEAIKKVYEDYDNGKLIWVDESKPEFDHELNLQAQIRKIAFSD